MGRDKRNEKKTPPFTPMLHGTMDCEAWLSLAVYSKALYPFLRRRAGYNGIKNGAVLCSVREAAAYLGTHKDTAAKALQELQRKGFLVAVRVGCLGMDGAGKATTWRLTEIGTPANSMPTREYLNWSAGNDYPVSAGKRQAA